VTARIRRELRKLAGLRPSTSNQEIFNELMAYATGMKDGGDDRALAIVGAAHLADALRQAITKHLHPARPADSDDQLFVDESAPLSGLAARTRMAWALGLLTEENRADLTIIRGIRNAFAHAPDHLSFKTDTVKKAVESLHVLKSMPDQEGFLKVAGPFVEAAKFTVAIAVFCQSISSRSPHWDQKTKNVALATPPLAVARAGVISH
jgi:Mannitol repressor